MVAKVLKSLPYKLPAPSSKHNLLQLSRSSVLLSALPAVFTFALLFCAAQAQPAAGAHARWMHSQHAVMPYFANSGVICYALTARSSDCPLSLIFTCLLCTAVLCYMQTHPAAAAATAAEASSQHRPSQSTPCQAPCWQVRLL